ncbi:MAG: hypothetical protein KAQ94_04195 [Arcobacteraceae bacterium]|nr:hypothetical protein [Arcobacteraceae bacterium]
MQQFNYKLIILSIFLFTGCGLSTTQAGSYKSSYYHSTQVTDFSDLTANLLKDLSPTIVSLKKDEPLYVIDFVNLKQLENHSELGFVLSSELKTLVTQQCNRAIYEIEFTKYLKLGSNGSKLLSRNIADIQNKQLSNTSYALVGTYAFTQRQVIVYLKLIDLSNGVIIKSSTVKTALTDEIILLEQKENVTINNIETTEDLYTPFVL